MCPMTAKVTFGGAVESQYRRKVQPPTVEQQVPLFGPSSAQRPDSQTDRRQSGRGAVSSRAAATSVPGLRARIRAPRHSGIFTAVHRLDATLDAAARADLAGWVKGQYASEYGDIPLGFVATCHLGPPFVDHRLDLIFSIVEHYAPADTMPEPFASARMMVRTGSYEFIEVYASGQLVPVLRDGTAVPA